ncbi:MAG: ABC transporter substrate-binding protein, partial [Deltaproteobacteria bacterium]
MKRNILMIVLILISVTLFQGCQKRQKPDPETLYFNLDTEPPTLDPSKAADTTSGLVIENLFDGLVDYDVTKPNIPIIPKVAKSWKVSPDGRVYTYYLRDDIYWTDGKKVT